MEFKGKTSHVCPPRQKGRFMNFVIGPMSRGVNPVLQAEAKQTIIIDLQKVHDVQKAKVSSRW
jgi:hypothetical protein